MLSDSKDDHILRAGLAIYGKPGFGPVLPWDFVGFTEHVFVALEPAKGLAKRYKYRAT